MGAAAAVAPVAPVSPRPEAMPTPLGRSGIDRAGLIATTDIIVERPAAAGVAQQVGLEQARAALVGNRPAIALATLDGIWDAARRTEEGWYLRGGALSLLGLPDEGARVAEQGLSVQRGSLALRLLQAVARLSMGDAAGARQALTPALQQAPQHPLLLAQQAAALARQGLRRQAEGVLRRVEEQLPSDDPVVRYGRTAVRAATALVARDARTAPMPGVPGQHVEGEGVHALPTPVGGVATMPDAAADPDPITAALRRIGVALRSEPSEAAFHEARAVLRALSAGGPLAGAAGPARAHAARTLVTTLLARGAGADADAASPGDPLQRLLTELLPTLRAGRAAEADGLVRRAAATVREPTAELLRALVGGSVGQPTPARGLAIGGPALAEGAVHGAPRVQGDATSDLLLPLRLGLALVPPSDRRDATGGGGRVPADALATPSMGDLRLSGWGPASVGGWWGGGRWTAGGQSGVAVSALLLVLAVGALAGGGWAPAVVLAVLAAAAAGRGAGRPATDRASTARGASGR